MESGDRSADSGHLRCRAPRPQGGEQAGASAPARPAGGSRCDVARQRRSHGGAEGHRSHPRCAARAGQAAGADRDRGLRRGPFRNPAGRGHEPVARQGGGGDRIRRDAGPPDRGGRRRLSDAVALRALRPEPDVQPGLRYAAHRLSHRWSARYRGRCDRADHRRWHGHRVLDGQPVAVGAGAGGDGGAGALS